MGQSVFRGSTSPILNVIAISDGDDDEDQNEPREIAPADQKRYRIANTQYCKGHHNSSKDRHDDGWAELKRD